MQLLLANDYKICKQCTKLYGACLLMLLYCAELFIINVLLANANTDSTNDDNTSITSDITTSSDSGNDAGMHDDTDTADNPNDTDDNSHNNSSIDL